MLLNSAMRSAIGWLYAWKNVLLIAIILASIVIYRPFCKYLCRWARSTQCLTPISVFRYRTDPDKCVSCGACARACKMNCDPVKNSNDPECIRCGLCKKACPTGAISCGWKEPENLVGEKLVN